MKNAAWLALFAACSSVPTTPLVDPPYAYRSSPASLPAEKCGEALDCWRRRTLLYVETNDALVTENRILSSERDEAREGETYAINTARRLKKESEPSVLSNPFLWFAVGVVGGIVLSIGAGAAWGAASKALR